MKYLRAAVLAVVAPSFLLDGMAAAPSSCGFTLVDPRANESFYELANFDDNITIDYHEWNRGAFNIRVNTGCYNEPVGSVFIEWDLNIPKYKQNYGNFSHCEKYTPYSVFKDKQKGNESTWKNLGNYGDFNDALLPLGVHTLKASAFSSNDCSGNPISEPPLTSTVAVDLGGDMSCPGGVATFELWDTKSDNFVSTIEDGDMFCYVPSAMYDIRASTPACLKNRGEIKFRQRRVYATLENGTDLLLWIANYTKVGPLPPRELMNQTSWEYRLVDLAYGNFVQDNGKLQSYKSGLNGTLHIKVTIPYIICFEFYLQW